MMQKASVVRVSSRSFVLDHFSFFMRKVGVLNLCAVCVRSIQTFKLIPVDQISFER
jgi:hypothetical protein